MIVEVPFYWVDKYPDRGGLLQGIQLEIGVLILGRNSRVADPYNKRSLSLH